MRDNIDFTAFVLTLILMIVIAVWMYVTHFG
jgi:hypothetical protein